MLVGFWDDAINVCTIFYLQSLTSSSLLGFCSFSILYFQWSSDYFNQLQKKNDREISVDERICIADKCIFLL